MDESLADAFDDAYDRDVSGHVRHRDLLFMVFIMSLLAIACI